MNKADADFPLALFFLAWRGFTARRDALLAEFGLGQVHHRVLFILAREPGARVGELAAALGISRQALHRPLSQLQAGGMVESRVPEGSGRERALHLTEAGRKLERRVAALQRRVIGRALASVDPAGRAAWARVMRALAAEIEHELPAFARELLASGETAD